MNGTPRFKYTYRFETDRDHTLTFEVYARRNGKMVEIKRSLFTNSKASQERIERLLESAVPNIKRWGNEYEIGLYIHQNWSPEYEAYRASVEKPAEFWKWHLTLDSLKDANKKLDEFAAADQPVPTDLLQRIAWYYNELGIKV